MEQRSLVRKTTRIGVVVSCPQFGLFRGEIENVSMEGVYVRTRNVHVCLNAPVTLTFQPEPALPLLNCSAEGVVVHQDAVVRKEDGYVVFVVEEGDRYRTGTIQLQGNQVFDEAKLREFRLLAPDSGRADELQRLVAAPVREFPRDCFAPPC